MGIDGSNPNGYGGLKEAEQSPVTDEGVSQVKIDDRYYADDMEYPTVSGLRADLEAQGMLVRRDSEETLQKPSV